MARVFRGTGFQPQSSGIEENRADLLADARGSGVADKEDVAAEAGEFLLEQAALGGFAGAFGAVEDEENSGSGHATNIAGSYRLSLVIGPLSFVMRYGCLACGGA